MKLELIKLGKIAHPPITDLVALYHKRLQAYTDATIQIFKTEFKFSRDVFLYWAR